MKTNLPQPRSGPSAADTLQRAIALHQQGDIRQAGALYLEVLAAEPDNFDALHLLGVYAQQTGDNQAACDLIARALSIDPGSAIAHTNLGIVLERMKRYDDALAAHQKALDLAPDTQAALNNYGATLLKLRRPAEAAAYFERALHLDPAYAEAMGNLGNSYIDMRRYEEALLCLDQALALNPVFIAAHFNRGNALHHLNRIDEALTAYRRTLELDPGHVDAHFNQGLCLLLNGDFERGWPEYEWRWRKEAYQTRQDLGRPPWLGQEPLAGKTILVHSEQGFGDSIQFCRYAILLAQQGARVILRVQPALTSLLAGLPGVHSVIADDAPLPGFDCHCPLMSLPLAFQTTLASVPAWPAYLSPVQDDGVWAARLGASGKPRIGLVWAGSPGHDNDAFRSIPLLRLLELVSDRARFVSLQKELRAVDRILLQKTGRIAHFADAQRNFSDTAALVAQMDLVVTVDTSVAHLAAAMGKPTWILLPFAPDWRWMLERGDSPWYPMARLFRQPRSGDWDSVIAAVGREMAAFLAAAGQAGA
ncbi:MAG TPA: tetratricopeptide repeat-containing glycosyltransferase family protein [Janthinobacterium sp.]|nr:tetratricopeptide repeat-containing glycosyltransferase family protein [Janthinobacterium sp.]